MVLWLAYRTSFQVGAWTTVYLHNPTSIAHLEDLRDRLFAALASVPHIGRKVGEDAAQAEALVAVVRAMERGVITTKEALEVFAQQRVPGFRFGRWIIEMVDEGVYLEAVFDEAA